MRNAFKLLGLAVAVGFVASPASAQVRPMPTEPRPAYLFIDFNTEDLENHGRFVTGAGPQYGPSSGGPHFVGASYDSHPAVAFQTMADRSATEYCQDLGYARGKSLEVTAVQLISNPNNRYAYRIKRLVCFSAPPWRG